jgi:hypothetical protein
MQSPRRLIIGAYKNMNNKSNSYIIIKTEVASFDDIKDTDINQEPSHSPIEQIENITYRLFDVLSPVEVELIVTRCEQARESGQLASVEIEFLRRHPANLYYHKKECLP